MEESIENTQQKFLEVEKEERPSGGIKNRVYYFSFALTATLLFGTKLTFIGLSHLTKSWIFWIEHISICLTSISIFLLFYFIVQSKHMSLYQYVSQEMTLLKNKKILVCALISGFMNAAGNISIIFAIKLAHQAGSNSAAINSIIMLNVLFALIAGICMFNEKHSIVQYFGGLLIIGATILISFERKFEAAGIHTEEQNRMHYLAVMFALFTCLTWSLKIIVAKYAWYWYQPNMIEFASLVMMLSGLIGSMSIFYIWFYQIPFGHREGSEPFLNFTIAILAGAFTAIAQVCYFSAINLGSVEVAQLFINMKPIVQLIEEALFLFLLPNLFALIGLIVAVIGCTLIMFGHPKDAKEVPNDAQG